jgi:hypothetical protein
VKLGTRKILGEVRDMIGFLESLVVGGGVRVESSLPIA